MKRTLRSFVYDLKKNCGRFFLISAVIFLLCTVFFASISLIRKLTSAELPLWVMSGMFVVLPYLLYIPAFVLPLMTFRKSVLGRDAMFMQGFSLPRSAFTASMLLNTLIWTAVSRLLFAALNTISLLLSEGTDKSALNTALMLSFSRTGLLLGIVMFIYQYLAIVFLQLFICAVSLLAALDPEKRGILSAVYGGIGGAMIVFSYTLVSALTSETVTEVGSAGAAVLPQMLYFLSFSVFFGFVTAAVMKRIELGRLEM